MRIISDKYYTPAEVANWCVDKCVDFIGFDNITEALEPSVGNGWTVEVVKHYLSYIPDILSADIDVISLYDGMSCGRIALTELGANIRSYKAYEIDKFAIQTTQANFPDTVQLGDAFAVRAANWKINT